MTSRIRQTLPLFLMVVLPQLLLIVITLGPPAADKKSGTNVSSPPPGRWEILVQNAGIASMHTVLTHMDTVVLLDRRDGGSSQIALPGNRSVEGDRTAHSVVLSFNWSAGGVNSVRPLTILTDTWCSSGQVRVDGTVVQTGGNADDKSGQTIRTFTPCHPDESCDWVEESLPTLLATRWYATNQILPDGETTIIVGGHQVSTYEYVPQRGTSGTYQLSLLQNGDEDRMYPFVHLLPSGHLFIFARMESVLLDIGRNSEVKTFPTMPGGVARNYPASGSSALLPLDIRHANATVLICGGTLPNAHSSDDKLRMPASDTCGSITVSSGDDVKENPQWSMFTMPRRRVMGDIVLLPNGRVLIINGAMNGTAGWGDATQPCLEPVVFDPRTGEFEVQVAATKARMYHSTANLLPDGRVLVAGSNTHVHYNFQAEFPTELSVEAFSPGYLSPGHTRPAFSNEVPSSLGYGEIFSVDVHLGAGQQVNTSAFTLRLANAPYSTHSFSMGQRQLLLPISSPTTQSNSTSITLVSKAPQNSNLAPPGYYMLFPLYNEKPGRATWVHIG